MSDVPDMALMRVYDERDQWKAHALKAEAALAGCQKVRETMRADRMRAEEALRDICKLVEANEWRSVNEEVWIIARAALSKKGG